MNNKIINELEQKIEDFDIRLLTDVKKIFIENTSCEKSFLIEFNYIDYKKKEQYVVCMKFEKFKVDTEIGVDINDLLNINKLNFEDISFNHWEDINWLVTDSDDDGMPLFSFFCNDICILINHKLP